MTEDAAELERVKTAITVAGRLLQNQCGEKNRVYLLVTSRTDKVSSLQIVTNLHDNEELARYCEFLAEEFRTRDQAARQVIE